MSEEAADFKHAIRNVDEDILKCEEFLCKVLNTRVNTPLQLSALQSALENHRLMATRPGNSAQIRGQKSIKPFTTPPIKLNRAGVAKNLENDFKNTVKPKRTVDKATCRSRATSCCSERSLKPSPLIETEEEQSVDITVDFKNDAKKYRLHSASNSLVTKRSWSQLLADNHKATPKVNNLNILPGTFSQFDPLRTLHFLSKELQSKLYTLVPEESSIHRIVLEIQNSLHRLPIPSTAEILAGNSYSDLNHTNYNHQYIQSSQTCQFTQTSALAVVHQYCQTDENLESSPQCKELELQIAKLELSNKNINEAYELTKKERDQMAETLKYHESNKKLLLDEIEELKKQVAKGGISAGAEEIITELKIKNKTLEDEKAALDAEYKAKLSIANETLEYIKNNKHSEYSSYMQYKLELDKKNTVINAQNIQLGALAKELERVQAVVRSNPQVNNMKEDNPDKSSQQILKITNYCDNVSATPASTSLSTLPESQFTKKPQLTEIKYDDAFKSKSDINGGVTFLSRNFDNDRSSSRITKSHNDSSNYSLHKKYSDRKYRPHSHKDQDYELRLKSSMRSNRSVDDDTLDGTSRSKLVISDIFNEVRHKVCKNANVTLPSPPRNFHHSLDLSSQSQWSDSM